MTVWLFSPLSAFMIERLHCKLTPTSLRSAFRTQNATCPNGFLQLLRKDLHFQRLLKHEYSRKWFSDQLTHEKSSKQKRSISIMTTKLTTPYIHTYWNLQLRLPLRSDHCSFVYWVRHNPLKPIYLLHIRRFTFINSTFCPQSAFGFFF